MSSADALGYVSLCTGSKLLILSEKRVRLNSGRWKQSDLKKWIVFNRVVRNVEYNEKEDNFKVVVKNASEDRVMASETFDMIFVASG